MEFGVICSFVVFIYDIFDVDLMYNRVVILYEGYIVYDGFIDEFFMYGVGFFYVVEVVFFDVVGVLE